MMILILFLAYLFRFGEIEKMLSFLSARRVYSAEFLSFGWSDSLSFLLFKPLVLAGTFAIFLKIKVRRSMMDIWAGVFQVALLLFFLASPGSDRFGLLLIFIPAIYLSEFIVLIWQRWVMKSVWKKIAFGFAFLLIFSQRTFPVLAQRILHPENVNEEEKCMRTFIEKELPDKIFTCEEQVLSFFPPTIFFRVPKTVPWAKANENIFPESHEWFLEGPYSRTEYFVNLENANGNWEIVWECGDGEKLLRLWRPFPETEFVASSLHIGNSNWNKVNVLAGF